MSNTDSPVGISRRTLVKSTALGGLALAAGHQRAGRARRLERLYRQLRQSLPIAYACGEWRNPLCRNR